MFVWSKKFQFIILILTFLNSRFDFIGKNVFEFRQEFLSHVFGNKRYQQFNDFSLCFNSVIFILDEHKSVHLVSLEIESTYTFLNVNFWGKIVELDFKMCRICVQHMSI